MSDAKITVEAVSAYQSPIVAQVSAKAQKISVEIPERTQRMPVEIGGCSGDLLAIQRLIKAALEALSRMESWNLAGAQAETLTPGSEATAALDTSGDAPLFTFGIPQGERGEKGEKGDTGEQGPQGERGEPGPIGSMEGLTVNGKAPDDMGAIVLSASDVGAVPESRMVNGRALTEDVTLSASDVGARPDDWIPTAGQVGAVPTTRTVNGKALSANVVLSASDVGALPSDGTASAAGKIVDGDGTNITPYDYNGRTGLRAENGSTGDILYIAMTDAENGVISFYTYMGSESKKSGRLLTSVTPVTVAQGGTGATDPATARDNLNITPANIGAVPTTRTINGKALSANVTLAPANISGVSYKSVDDFTIDVPVTGWTYNSTYDHYYQDFTVTSCGNSVTVYDVLCYPGANFPILGVRRLNNTSMRVYMADVPTRAQTITIRCRGVAG